MKMTRREAHLLHEALKYLTSEGEDTYDIGIELMSRQAELKRLRRKLKGELT